MLVDVPWGEVAVNTLLPPISFKSDYFVLLVGVLGTTISPYLFFWQASQEVEEQRAVEGDEPLREDPQHARKHLRRIRIDTWFGMAFSNAIALAIMMTTAVTLHTAGITDIQTSAQAAQIAFRHLQQVCSLEDDAAFDRGALPAEQAEDRQRQRALAGTTLSD